MKIVGVMSGTSVDGIDVALCDVQGQPPSIEATIIKAATVPYDAALRERILAVCQPGTIDELCRLNFEIGAAIADAILEIGGEHINHVDLIASHGQTVWHDVTDSGQVTSTLQIGTAAVIAERTRITTIDNFRARDVSAGGQGAPLTAYVDWLLLRHPDKWRAVQNIGGMGNVSFLPPSKDVSSPFIAFDTGPGNSLIDAAVFELTHQQQRYDHNGDMAAAGRVDEEWVHALLSDPYFQQPPPRTTGREKFGTVLAGELVAIGRQRGYSAEDIVATLTAFTAQSIAASYRDFGPAPVDEVILGGGGVHNQTLRTTLSTLLHPAVVLDHEAIGLDSDFKEALTFAILGYETWHNRTATLPGQTGATHSTVLGQITPGDNFERLIRETWR